MHTPPVHTRGVHLSYTWQLWPTAVGSPCWGKGASRSLEAKLGTPALPATDRLLSHNLQPDDGSSCALSGQQMCGIPLLLLWQPQQTRYHVFHFPHRLLPHADPQLHISNSGVLLDQWSIGQQTKNPPQTKWKCCKPLHTHQFHFKPRCHLGDAVLSCSRSLKPTPL